MRPRSVNGLCPSVDMDALRALVHAVDPNAVAAADDVDRGLISLALERHPLERLEFAQQMLSALSSFRRVRAARL